MSAEPSSDRPQLDDRACVLIRVPKRELDRLVEWMEAGNVVSELRITGQPPIDCDVQEAWASDI